MRFLSLTVQTYEWFLSTGNQKETVLVKEVLPEKEKTVKTQIGPSSLMDSSVDKLSSEELSAFVQLGMDLRRIRQNPASAA